MKYIRRIFENRHSEEEIVLTSRQEGKIIVRTKNGMIQTIEKSSDISFPFFKDQPVTVFMKRWACDNRFKWNGENACLEEKKNTTKKIFGIDTRYIPKENELRILFPNKFRK